MRVINRDNRLIEDQWRLLTEPDEADFAGADDIIVPYAFWAENRARLQERAGRTGVAVNGETPIEEAADDLLNLDLIALEFPRFTDGRCYSLARLLRERYQYQGELRAVGDVMRDQLFYLRRCGVDSFQVREDKDVEDALRGLADFSVTYQTAADGAAPIYKVR